MTDYSACLDLADQAHEAGIELIRYQSVRDRRGGINLALLSCACFAMPNPVRMTTWRLHFSNYGVNAICDSPEIRLGFSKETFAEDPRMTMTARL